MMLRLLRSPLLVALAAQSIGWLLAFAAARLGLVAGPWPLLGNKGTLTYLVGLEEGLEVLAQVVIQDRAVGAAQRVFGAVGIVHIAGRVLEKIIATRSLPNSVS